LTSARGPTRDDRSLRRGGPRGGGPRAGGEETPISRRCSSRGRRGPSSRSGKGPDKGPFAAVLSGGGGAGQVAGAVHATVRAVPASRTRGFVRNDQWISSRARADDRPRRLGCSRSSVGSSRARAWPAHPASARLRRDNCASAPPSGTHRGSQLDSLGDLDVVLAGDRRRRAPRRVIEVELQGARRPNSGAVVRDSRRGSTFLKAGAMRRSTA